MRFELIAIDMDDTVYLERDYVRSGFMAVVELITQECGISGFADFAWSLFEEGVRGNTFDLAVKHMKLDGDIAVERLVEHYRGHQPDIALTPDSRQFLEDVGGHVPLALITDGPPQSQRNKMHALGLDPYLDQAVVTYEHDATWRKPNATSFRYVQDTFGVAPASCIYIADNPTKDFDGPAELGWHALRIRRRESLHFELDSGIEEIESFADRTWLDD